MQVAKTSINLSYNLFSSSVFQLLTTSCYRQFKRQLDLHMVSWTALVWEIMPLTCHLIVPCFCHNYAYKAIQITLPISYSSVLNFSLNLFILSIYFCCSLQVLSATLLSLVSYNGWALYSPTSSMDSGSCLCFGSASPLIVFGFR